MTYKWRKQRITRILLAAVLLWLAWTLLFMHSAFAAEFRSDDSVAIGADAGRYVLVVGPNATMQYSS